MSKREAPSESPSSPAKKAKPLDHKFGFAVVGLGRIGKIHIKNVIENPNAKLLYIVDVDVVTAKKNSSHLSVPVVGDIETALKDPHVEAVIICTPTPSHRELILKSVRAHKAVLCEKPIATELADIDECYKEAEKQGVPLLCAFHRRFDPTFSKLHSQCVKGDIGTIQIVKTISRDNPVPSIAYLKTSGTIFHDCASHDLDLQRWITGEEPTEVYVAASSFIKDIKDINDWDTALITLKYKSGIVGSIDLSRKAVYGYDQRVEVLGDKGMLKAENINSTAVQYATVDGIRNDPYYYSFPQRYDITYNNELQHFIEVLQGKTKPHISHIDARNNAILANACEKSAKTGDKVLIRYDI
jgi:myo-inositol 2-dehydrogenase/D-chiro-inositol 1-dehydrogenase